MNTPPLKICYVIPKYDPDSEEHFFHVYQFLEETAKHAQIYLLIEKSESEPKFDRVIPISQRFWRYRPLRVLEFICIFLWLRASEFNGSSRGTPFREGYWPG